MGARAVALCFPESKSEGQVAPFLWRSEGGALNMFCNEKGREKKLGVAKRERERGDLEREERDGKRWARKHCIACDIRTLNVYIVYTSCAA
eukprot:1395507-Amorphochlora_amoeboformis.AAC.1